MKAQIVLLSQEDKKTFLDTVPKGSHMQQNNQDFVLHPLVGWIEVIVPTFH